MNKTTLSIILTALLLIPMQAVFFNNMVLFNVAVPIVFIYIIISLPITYSVEAATSVGFFCGLAVDILSDTLGVNALCCTVLAFIQRIVFHLYMASDVDLAEQRPSPRVMAPAAFMKYAVSMVALYCLMYFGIEAFQGSSFKIFIIRVVASTVYSFVIIYAIAGLNIKTREKRL